MRSPANMWSYYSEKSGTVDALQDYYPDLLAKNSVLQMAVTQIKMAEASVKQTMQEIADEEEDELS